MTKLVNSFMIEFDNDDVYVAQLTDYGDNNRLDANNEHWTDWEKVSSLEEAVELIKKLMEK